MKKIMKKIDSLRLPGNYFAGISSLFSGVPANVLVWSRKDSPYQEAPSLHQRFFIAICISGVSRLSVDGHLFKLSFGEGIVIFPFQHHYYLKPESEPVEWLCASFELPEDESLFPLRNLAFRMPDNAWKIIDQLLDVSPVNGTLHTGINNQLPHWISLLLTILLTEIHDHGFVAELRDLKQDITYQVTHYIHQNITKKITIGQLAKKFGMSESNLRRIFREDNQGYSLGDFILKIRLSHAICLFNNSAMNLSEIATQCGFSSIYAFSQTFKRHFKQSPMNYRRYLKNRRFRIKPDIKSRDISNTS